MHVLGRFLEELDEGQAFFEGISAGLAGAVLKRLLHETGTENSEAYWTHDLRRGHARDLQLAGARQTALWVPVCLPSSICQANRSGSF